MFKAKINRVLPGWWRLRIYVDGKLRHVEPVASFKEAMCDVAYWRGNADYLSKQPVWPE